MTDSATTGTVTGDQITCDGTSAVVVVFPAAIAASGDLVYNDDDDTVLEAEDIRDLANNASGDQTVAAS